MTIDYNSSNSITLLFLLFLKPIAMEISLYIYSFCLSPLFMHWPMSALLTKGYLLVFLSILWQ